MDGTDRLLSEKELIKIITERYGLTACGIIEAIRDCPTAGAMPIKYPYCEEFPQKGSHDKYWEEH